MEIFFRSISGIAMIVFFLGDIAVAEPRHGVDQTISNLIKKSSEINSCDFFMNFPKQCNRDLEYMNGQLHQIKDKKYLAEMHGELSALIDRISSKDLSLDLSVPNSKFKNCVKLWAVGTDNITVEALTQKISQDFSKCSEQIVNLIKITNPGSDFLAISQKARESTIQTPSKSAPEKPDVKAAK